MMLYQLESQAVYARRLWILLLTTILGVTLTLVLTARIKINFLGPGSIDLSRHAISEVPPGSSVPIVFVGGSYLAPDALPTYNTPAANMNERLGRTIAYNLATADGNLLTAMACAALAQPYHPKTVVLGLGPYDFTAKLAFSRLLIRRTDLITSYVDRKIIDDLKADYDFRLRFIYWSEAWLQRVDLFPALFYQNVFGLALELYGPFEPVARKEINRGYYLDMDAGDLPKIDLRPYLENILNGLSHLVANEGARLVVYFTPLEDGERVSFSPEREAVSSILDRLGVKHFDYSSLADAADFVGQGEMGGSGFVKVVETLAADMTSSFGPGVLR